MVLIIPVIGYGEYHRYTSLKDLNWGIKEKEMQGSSISDITFVWRSDQNKIVMDFPIVIENPADMDVVFSKIAFDISIWGLDAGGGEISQLHTVPAKGSKTMWIKNFEINVKDFENYVFTIAKGDKTKVDIDIAITTYYPFLNADVESGHATIEAEYALEKEEVERIIQKKLQPFVGS